MYKSVLISVLIAIFSLSFSRSYAQQLNNEVLEIILDKKIQMDKKALFKDKYRIQLYYGDFEEAEEWVKEFKKTQLPYSCTMIYQAPYHRVLVGNFNTRLQADKSLLSIKETYSNAIIVKLVRD
ncbi:MAG: SPOR domain-containing protein [Flavobacteriaceae bacterium]|nr:SPOR domain-containing protein [Flavobacteriaceae bacterium]